MLDSKEAILQDAEKYIKSHGAATFNTYETFKKRAEVLGLYNIIPTIVRILKI